MTLRPARPEDLAFVMRLEAEYSRLGFVSADDLAAHQRRLADPDSRYWMIEEQDAPQGYAILCGLSSANRSVELKRIIMAAPGQGHGRRALAIVVARAFDELSAHRLWLDVFEDNARARHVYRSLGFVEEGVMRDCVRYGNRYRSLVVMSILEPEYRRGRDR